MDLTEKIAYIKGLADGLSLDADKPEVKVLNAIIDLLDDITYEVQDMEELYDDLSAQVDEIDEDLANVESELVDDDADEDDDGYDFDDDDDEDVFFEGEITCPNCGEVLEFDFSDLFDEEDDDVCDGECDSCDVKEDCEGKD